jgi:hypothetical protein
MSIRPRTARSPQWPLVLGLAAMAAGCSTVTGAQVPNERNNARIRDRCENAARGVERLQNATAAANDLHSLAWCSESAGRVVPALWRAAPHDSAGLSQLLLASRNVRDERIRRAVDAAARDPQQPTAARVGALVVLASYADSSITALVSGSARGRGEASVGFARVDHPDVRDGAQPLTTSARFEVLMTLREIQASEPRGEIRDTAGSLLRTLTSGERR